MKSFSAMALVLAWFVTSGVAIAQDCDDGKPVFLMDTDKFKSAAVDGAASGPSLQDPIREVEELKANIISVTSPLSSVSVEFDGETKTFAAGSEQLTDQGGGMWVLSMTIGPKHSEADVEIDFGTVLVIFESIANNECTTTSRYSLIGGDSRVRAVVVGVSAYDNVSQLQFGADDAREFEAFLKSYFKDNEGELEVDLFVEDRATKREIMRRIKDISNSISVYGTFIFYFSGHGTIAENEDEELTAYLVLKDSETEEEQWSMLDKQSVVTKYMARSKATKKIYIIDSCLSGVPLPSSQSSPVLGQQKRLDLSPRIAQEISDPSVMNEIFDPPAGVIGLVSSGGAELSYEIDPVGGIFTHYLKISANEMDPDKSGSFNYSQLVEATKQKIQSERGQLDQIPQVLADPDKLERNGWLDDEPVQ